MSLIESLVIAQKRANVAEARARKLEAAVKDLREVAFDGPSESKGSGCAESVKQWRDRIEMETRPVEVPRHIDDDDENPAGPTRDANNRSPA